MKPLSSNLLQGTDLSKQMELEKLAIRRGVLHYRRLANDAVERGDGAALKPAERLLIHWLDPMVAAIRDEKRACRKGSPDVGRSIYGPMLVAIDAERMAVIAIHETLGATMSRQRVPATNLAYAIGRAVIAELNCDRLKADHKEVWDELKTSALGINAQRVNCWAKKTLEDIDWDRRVCIHLGMRLIWLLIGVASVGGFDEDNFILAFHHKRVHVRKGQTRAFIELSHDAAQVIEDGHLLRQTLRPKFLPMLVQPYPWSKDAQGGYTHIRTPFVSKPTPSQKAAFAEADLSQVHECLNALNATPWRINRWVYHIATELWHQGGGVAGIPRANNLPIPPKPAGFREEAPKGEAWEAVSEEVAKQWKHDASSIYRANAQMRSERVMFQKAIDVAEHVIEHGYIWQPHQFDFRGRAYPIPPYLNHQGADLSRGLMEFANERPVSDDDLWWIAVHLANSAGHDKGRYKDRVAWVTANLNEIERWVSDPLSNTGWMDTENPWQTLAAAKAMVDPAAAAHLPVQLDGTCNGLQHYAAIGRDMQGAAVVNLLPGEYPSDVYSDVAEAVERLVEADAQMGCPEALAVAHLINRKTVKQPVMTSVYGVTQVGARKQVQARLQEQGMEGDESYKCGRYLSMVVMRGIGEVCSAATEAMDWMRKCAGLIAMSGQLVRWETPIGFPVVQPYRNRNAKKIRTVLQEVVVYDHEEDLPVSVNRQRNGFAPNFIHSIDATHMLMTARECHREGLAFAAVHDSYWTHAADVDRMAAILREQFVELHRRPLLDDLHEQLRTTYPELDFPEPPGQGELDINVVLDSPYFFM